MLGNDNNKSRNKIANHSARKTTLSKLLDNKIHPLHVSQLSGHKNTDSLKSYHSANKRKQQQMSQILSSGSGNADFIDFRATKINNFRPATTVASTEVSAPIITTSASLVKQTDTSNSTAHSSSISNTNILPPSVQQQMIEEWDPVKHGETKVFYPNLQGATIGERCNIDIKIYTSGNFSPPRTVTDIKRRRVVIEDDSD